MARNNRFRRANSGLPGYDNLGFESFGHPASKAQPSVDDYGIDSEFGEGVRKGPYRSGPAPASYAWTPDHPAADDEIIDDFAETRDLYEANLKKAMERKAAKCIEIAESRLGKTASQGEIEDLALRFMDLPSRQINAKLQSLASDFLAGDELQEATGHEGEDVGPGNVTAEDVEATDSMAEELAEEIAMLKAANARLTRQMRKLAEDVVQKETGHEGEDESVDTLDSTESEGATKKLASEAMAEDMAILSEMMTEAAHMGDSDRMAEIMAEMDIIAKTYQKHNAYGEAAPGFGYQDPDVRAQNRANKDSDWNKKTKKFHNLNYYTANKELWKKADDIMASDILSDEEFAEVMAEMELMAEEAVAGGKGSGGNTKGTRKVINQYGEAAPGFGYQDPDVRAQNRANRDSDWNKKTKSFYNKNYYSGNRGKIDGWPTPENPRVAEMAMAEEALAAEEQAMLDEMLAEMESMANQNVMAEDVEATHSMAEEAQATHSMAEEAQATHSMAEEAVAGHHMGEEAVAGDHMGLDLMSDEIGLDPKLARIFQAAEDVAEETAEEAQASEEVAEETAEEAVATKKSASFRPQTQARQASVKTLGNISREASSASDELSKLWESAPDVSKFFG